MLLRGGKASGPQALSLHDYPQGPHRWRFTADRLKADLGSKVTGVALVADYAKRGKTVVWAMDLQHRGQAIKDALDSRRGIRRGRRIARPDTVLHGSNNRTRLAGWLAPSLMSRVLQCHDVGAETSAVYSSEVCCG